GGHHVRLLGGDARASVDGHHRPDTDGAAVDALLDQTVDLTTPANLGQRSAWLLTAVDTLAGQTAGAELVFAVVGALEPEVLSALARVGAVSQGWAMVRSGRGDGHPATPDETRTLDSLRRAGWTACAVEPGE